ncbi:hypothetical protein GGS23DRAFT_569799 [Durotheca rogersii]|uniref:uncharacterized protein n=1 Tax=Durotheca rogersii TaxID=419775 RepID=UPI002220E170|nr:uncharacterized protein GGS23DRAFT_569799 [Durotheca rogersii]KAI5862858.1 hypothetical protein GGS23DRAFT_569799 [Durotheca rogersii]
MAMSARPTPRIYVMLSVLIHFILQYDMDVIDIGPTIRGPGGTTPLRSRGNALRSALLVPYKQLVGASIQRRPKAASRQPQGIIVADI